MNRLTVLTFIFLLISAASALASVSTDDKISLTLQGGDLVVCVNSETTSLSDKTFLSEKWDISFEMQEGDGDVPGGRRVAFNFQNIGESRVPKNTDNNSENNENVRRFTINREYLPTTRLITILTTIQPENWNRNSGAASHIFATNGADLAIKAANGDAGEMSGTLMGSVITGP
jgi:hypothetical protein